MEEVWTQLVVFLIIFLVVYIAYYVVVVRKSLKETKENPPLEVQYLILKYHLDLRQIEYARLLNTIAVVGALDISIVVMIVSLLEGVVIPLIVGFGLLVLIILISFRLIGKIYQKKGKIRNENNKRNRK